MLNRRTVLMSGAAAILATLQPARAQDQEEGMVLRRAKLPGEDEFLFRYGQPGRSVPAPNATLLNLEDLSIVLHYPRYVYRAPLIVFSHGTLGDPIMYRGLIEHLVSHGFVVASPVHDDSIFQRGLLTRRTHVDGSAIWDFGSLLNDASAWIERARACVRPLDLVDRISETISVKIDDERPIIVGHEFGAFVASLLMGGTATTGGGDVVSISDPRWYAGALLSSQGAGVMGLDDNSWSGITRPLLVVQGAVERDILGQTPQQKIDPYWKSPAGNKHLAWFSSGDRNLFTLANAGLPDESLRNVENVRGLLTAYCDAYANYRAEIFQLLTGPWMSRATLKSVETMYR